MGAHPHRRRSDRIGRDVSESEATIAYVHETCAPFLLGEDPTHREKLTHSLSYRIGNHFNGFPSRSVEVRGNSAVDMALWDLCGKAVGLPLYRLLGGLFRTECRILQHLRGGQLQQPDSARVRHRTAQPGRSVAHPRSALMKICCSRCTNPRVWRESFWPRVSRL